MAKWLLAVAGAVLLSGCGGKSADPEKQALDEALAVVASCYYLPDFVDLYRGAKVSTCARGGSPIPNHESGTVTYTTTATASDVLAWYKAQAAEAGLADNTLMNGPAVYGARDGQKRTFMAMTAPAPGGTAVTLTWGRDLDQ